MKLPEEVREALLRRYQNQHCDWLAGGGQWPLTLALGCPTENEAQRQRDATRAWVSAWQSFRGPGQLGWCERQWPALGTQDLPERLVLQGPDEVARWVNQEPRWLRARARYVDLCARWPALGRTLPRYFDILADYDASDFERLINLVAWLEAHPDSGLYPRQLPVSGLDSKWLESRKALVTRLVAQVRGANSETKDFYAACGLRALPQAVRALILDPELRQFIGGVRDISLPLDQFVAAALPVRRVFIVENLQTGLAFGDLPGSVVFMRLGYGVTQLARIPWVVGAQCIYWGDLDTHGFTILNLARSQLPRVDSLLMDEGTLLKHRPLWGREEDPSRELHLPLLTASEHALFDALKTNRWEEHVRLEQERLDWKDAWSRVLSIV